MTKSGKKKFKKWLKKQGKSNQQQSKKRGNNMSNVKEFSAGNTKGYIVDDYYSAWEKGKGIKVCSHYPRRIARVGDITIYGATKSQIDFDSFQGKDLILNCSEVAITSGKDFSNLINGPACFAELNQHIVPMKELHLKWSDGGVFPVGLAFWQNFYDICLKENLKHIIACCLGGHGRTGTAVASFIIANSAGDYRSVRNTVRAVYCGQSIETYSQEEYLERLDFERFNEPAQFRDYDVDWSPTLAEIQARVEAKKLEMEKDKIVIDLTKDDSTDTDTDTTKYHPDNCSCENCNSVEVVFKAEDYSEDKQLVNQEILKEHEKSEAKQGWLKGLMIKSN